MCIFHFPWFSVFRLYSRSFSVHFFIFHAFFSDFIIFRRWRMFLYFPWFSVLLYSTSYSGHFKFSTFFQFSSLTFHALKCVFIFRDFQFSRLYSRSFSVHFYFSRFLVISLFFVAGGMFSFSMIFSFYFCYIPRPTVDILNFSTFFQFFSLIFHVLKCILFSVIFSFLAYIPGPSVCIFYFSRF